MVVDPSRVETPTELTASSVDLGTVHTPSDLATKLEGLRSAAGLSLNDVRRRADDLFNGVPHAVPLPTSTVGDVCSGKSIPTPQTLRMVLLVCGVPAERIGGWMAARERAITANGPAAGAVRVRDSNPRLLGVHASIQVDSDIDELPVYVPRDVDDKLRTAIAGATERGEFILVKGPSSVGKTRTLFEAVKALLPDHWLLHPADAAEARGFADAPVPHTVVWLDELQRADTGGVVAADRLARLLAQQGWVEELRQRADAGDDSAAHRLADLLAGQGLVDELRQRADAGDDSAADRLADLLAGQGRVDELRQRADAGDYSAALSLVDLLIEQGRLDLLEQEMHAGVIGAAARLERLI